MGFFSSGTFWHCVCTGCGTSLFDEAGATFTNKQLAIVTANSLGWHIWRDGDVICPECLASELSL